MEHLGFIIKHNFKFALIYDGKYQIPLPGGKKIITTLASLRKAGWKIEPWKHISEEGLRLLNG